MTSHYFKEKIIPIRTVTNKNTTYALTRIRYIHIFLTVVVSEESIHESYYYSLCTLTTTIFCFLFSFFTLGERRRCWQNWRHDGDMRNDSLSHIRFYIRSDEKVQIHPHFYLLHVSGCHGNLNSPTPVQ